MQGEAEWGEKWRADGVGKELSMVSEAKENTENWRDIVPVCGYLGVEDSTWMEVLAQEVHAGQNNLLRHVKEPLNSHIREFLKQDSSMSKGHGRSNTYQILRRDFYP